MAVKTEFKKIAVIGIGMIGGSIAMAVRKKIPEAEITGVDTDSRSLSYALKNKFIHKGMKPSISNYKLLSDCSIIIIAVPVNMIAETAVSVLPFLSDKTILTDTGSVKEKIVREIEKKCGKKSRFIGSHPLAGVENSGITAASNTIIEGKKVIITPAEGTMQMDLAATKKFWSAIGMKPVVTSPEEHDTLLAVTSHLPHVLAYLLMNTISTTKSGSINPLTFAGSGFKDFTRIAKSDPELWAQIVLANREQVLDAISKFEKNLSEIRMAIKKSDAGFIKHEFRKARELRKKIK